MPRDPETYLPASTVLEFDLVLKARGYTSKERENALDWLSSSVAEDKILCSSVASLGESARLQEKGMGYFDSLITSLAAATNALVVTKDRAISEFVRTGW